MIDFTKEPTEQVIEAKKVLQHWESHWGDSYDEMRAAVRFRHNTDGTGQWKDDDVRVLNEQGRPVLTMNLVAHKIESVVGMNEENRKRWTAQAVGDEDKAAADLVNAVLGSIGADTMQNEIEREAFEREVTIGEANIAISTTPDPENPAWVKIRLSPIFATDIAWDPASERRDASDARGLFWSRWVTKDEFKAEYPHLTGQIDELFNEDGGTLGMGVSSTDDQGETDYSRRREGRLGHFIDRKRGELRIVHYECKSPRRVIKATTPAGVQQIDEETAEALRLSGRPDVQIAEVWEDVYYWLEFTHIAEPLFTGLSPEPFKGFTVKRAQCYRDEDTGYPYGLVRHMMDPARDVNKAFSASQEHIMLQAKPGWTAEQGAIPDLKKFEEANATGGTAIVNNGALAGGQLLERKPAIYSDAQGKRLEIAMSMLDRVSGIFMDAESPVRGQEAATTVLLRDRKALRAMVQPMRNFERMQEELAWAIIEVVANVMPTDQIVALAGDSNRWQIDPSSGAVIDTERKVPVDLRSLRALKFDLEAESVDASEMKSVHELNLLMQAKAVEIPIDPEVIYSRFPMSRSEKESLKAYARNLEAGQAQAAQAEMQTAQQQLAAQNAKDQAEVQIKAAAQQETARHNQTDEKLDLVIELLKILQASEAAKLQADTAAAKQVSASLQ